MNKPFLLKPTGKDYIWGGQRLNEEFGKNINLDPLAETWECSTHPDGPSFVTCGEFSGQSLASVLKLQPDFLGSKYKELCELPILVKFIDANQDLSVQVHPSDEYAKEQENGQLGKTEMWYVLDADPGAKLVYGFNKDMTESSLRTAVGEGRLEENLQYVPVKKGDVFFIEAGTVHAIGAGTLVAEIQENSNLTYRLYDYDRVGADGKKRQLHVDKALKVLNMKKMALPEQNHSSLLSSCRYFEVYRMKCDEKNPVEYQSDSTSYRVLLCTEGSGTICFESGSFSFRKGDCIFVPACSEQLKISGNANFLDIRG